MQMCNGRDTCDARADKNNVVRYLEKYAHRNGYAPGFKQWRNDNRIRIRRYLLKTIFFRRFQIIDQ